MSRKKDNDELWVAVIEEKKQESEVEENLEPYFQKFIAQKDVYLLNHLWTYKYI